MNTTEFLKAYLHSLGIEHYTLTEAQDSIGYLISLTVGKDENIGVLIGKGGRNIKLLKQLLRVVGLAEKINPFVILKVE